MATSNSAQIPELIGNWWKSEDRQFAEMFAHLLRHVSEGREFLDIIDNGKQAKIAVSIMIQSALTSWDASNAE